jgi:hypothetical protein
MSAVDARLRPAESTAFVKLIATVTSNAVPPGARFGHDNMTLGVGRQFAPICPLIGPPLGRLIPDHLRLR